MNICAILWTLLYSHFAFLSPQLTVVIHILSSLIKHLKYFIAWCLKRLHECMHVCIHGMCEYLWLQRRTQHFFAVPMVQQSSTPFSHPQCMPQTVLSPTGFLSYHPLSLLFLSSLSLFIKDPQHIYTPVLHPVASQWVCLRHCPVLNTAGRFPHREVPTHVECPFHTSCSAAT